VREIAAKKQLLATKELDNLVIRMRNERLSSELQDYKQADAYLECRGLIGNIAILILKKTLFNTVEEILETNLGDKRRRRLVRWQGILNDFPNLQRDLKSCAPDLDFDKLDIQYLYKNLSDRIYGYWIRDSDITIPERSTDKDAALIKTLSSFAEKQRIGLDGMIIREQGFTAALKDWEEIRRALN
jgi:hypothetical protein